MADTAVIQDVENFLSQSLKSYSYGVQIEGLTHWGPVMYICVHELKVIGSDNGLSPGRCQAII